MSSKKSAKNNRHICPNCLIKVKKYNVRCPFCDESFYNHIPYILIIGFSVFSAVILLMIALRI